MLRKLFISAVIVIAFLIGCKKESITDPLPQLHKYEGQWSDKISTGPFQYFSFDFKMQATGDGTVGAIYKPYGSGYPTSTLRWTRIDKDSVKIAFDFGAYPDESWEIRAVNNGTEDMMDGVYFRIKKSDTTDRVNYGYIQLGRK